MDIKEFNKVVKRTETNEEVIFDVRPFGDRQGEAVDEYLHQALASLQYGTGTFGPRLVVLLHDASANIPQSAHRWLANLAASGVRIEIRPFQGA
jgi:hypothetical protein